MVEGEPKILSFVVTIHGENVAVLRRRQRGADGITVSMPIGMGSVDDMRKAARNELKSYPKSVAYGEVNAPKSFEYIKSAANPVTSFKLHFRCTIRV
jgi:hypothetical protein